MKVTGVKLFKPNKQSALKAYGSVSLGGVVDLKLSIIDTGTGPFITWKGTESYTDKEGKKKYASPIFVTDENLKKEIDQEVINKYTVEIAAQAGGNAGSADAGFGGDMPF